MSTTSTRMPGAPATARPRQRGWRGIRPWALPVIGLGVAFAFLWPYLVMLLDAFRPSSDVVKTPPSLLPEQWKWTTFSEVLGDDRFLAWLKSSLVISLSSTAIVVVVAIPAAYFTARFRFRGRMAFLFLVLVTQMFAPTSLVVGIYREFYALTLVDTYQALILTNAAFNLAFAIWILHGFFAAIHAAAHLELAHLTAPDVSPPTRCFSMTANNTTTGTIATMEAANSWSQFCS